MTGQSNVSVLAALVATTKQQDNRLTALHKIDAVPRAGNASGGGHPGWIVKCKGWETDPDAYTYVVAQVQAFPTLAKLIGHEDWLTDPDYSTPEARLPRLAQVFDEIEKWTKVVKTANIRAD